MLTKADPAFAKVKTDEDDCEVVNGYDLNVITNNYTQFKLESHTILNTLQQYIQNPKANYFSSFSVALIYLTRAKQLNLDYTSVLDQSKQEELSNQLEATRQLFYLIKMFGQVLFPKKTAIESLKQDSRVTKLIREDHPLDKLIEPNRIFSYIHDNKPDIQKAYENPSKTHLEPILDLFYLNDDVGYLFTAKHEQAIAEQEPIIDHCPVEERMYRLTQNHPSWKLNALIEEYLQLNTLSLAWNKNSNYFRELSSFIDNYIQAIEKYQQLFKQLLNNKLPSIDLHSYQQLTAHPFPVICVAEDDNSFECISDNGEYRALKPLQIGHDIKKLATDTNEHAQQIKDYLEKHNISRNINIMLINDLNKAVENNLQHIPSQSQSP